MEFLHRRFPLYGRPYLFLPAAGIFLLGLFWGHNWDWSWSLQTGNLFLLIRIPDAILSWKGGKALFLLLGLIAGASLFLTGTQNRTATLRQRQQPATPRWKRATFRFYPMTFFFGLFLLFFGFLFFFDASLYVDAVPGGFAVFVYLDYAGLVDRPFVASVGVLLMSVGMVSCMALSFQRGLGLTSTPRQAAPPTPSSRVGLPTLR